MGEFSVTNHTSDDGSAVVSVVGEIDLASAPELRTVLLATDGNVVVDLAAVTFMDSSGLAALVAARTHTIDAGHRFAVQNENDLVKRTMELTGLYEHFHPDDNASS